MCYEFWLWNIGENESLISRFTQVVRIPPVVDTGLLQNLRRRVINSFFNGFIKAVISSTRASATYIRLLSSLYAPSVVVVLCVVPSTTVILCE